MLVFLGFSFDSNELECSSYLIKVGVGDGISGGDCIGGVGGYWILLIDWIGVGVVI
jgi:hypothetical protein